MVPEFPSWPYVPTLARLGLALAIGLLVGIERERRKKGAGVRTFAFAAILGAVGGLLGEAFALLTLALLGVLVVLLNVETIRSGEGAEMTTSAALLVTAFAGVLAGQGHTFTPTVVGIMTAALLAWKQPLASFSRALTESELRSAILLAILTFVVYPVLPTGQVDPWGLVEPRSAWITVILIATLGFANYVLLKLYGARGLEITGFLGGLVNSRVTVTELAHRTAASGGRLARVAFRAVVLAIGAMLLRNMVILGLLAPRALLESVIPLTLMLLSAAGVALGRGRAGQSRRAVPEKTTRPGTRGPSRSSPRCSRPSRSRRPWTRPHLPRAAGRRDAGLARRGALGLLRGERRGGLHLEREPHCRGGQSRRGWHGVGPGGGHRGDPGLGDERGREPANRRPAGPRSAPYPTAHVGAGEHRAPRGHRCRHPGPASSPVSRDPLRVRRPRAPTGEPADRRREGGWITEGVLSMHLSAEDRIARIDDLQQQ